ncbi:fibrohexamerin-like [Hyposmocoma kahamanoa]|uniref:fibrohexamerin-like n=1 Tax=Hyposmocoma kahamanoa TaxID=1477025 RepID=UPI000E6D907F|nr:fibrohexamerin-like [Hyposmocoma kahamanoa]
MLLKLIIFSALAAAATSSPSAPAKSALIRPCRLNDYRCIGDNLAANSKCYKKVAGSIQSRYVLRDFRFEAPYFNSSYVEDTVVVKNHNLCYVSEFFVNQKADTMVLSVDCPYFVIETNSTVIRHNSLMEDQTYRFYNKATYPLIRLTANLKHADKLDICSAFVFTDVATLPIIDVAPLDTPTANFLSTDLTLLNIFEREAFLYRGFPMFRYFVNSYICNFGCNS